MRLLNAAASALIRSAALVVILAALALAGLAVAMDWAAEKLMRGAE